MIAAVCRLPLDGDAIVRTLRDLEPVANDPTDAEYTTFWLVVADQLQKRGLESPARAHALRIIESDADIRLMRSLGMEEKDLKTREATLRRLGVVLTDPPIPRKRATLKGPQPLLLQPAEVYAFPVDRAGGCANPYFNDDELATIFEAAGWGVLLVLSVGHALGYLAWYHLAVAPRVVTERPQVEEALQMIGNAKRSGVGTLRRSHVRRLGLVRLGEADTMPKVKPVPERRLLDAAASDISVSNFLQGSFTRGSSGARKTILRSIRDRFGRET